MKDYADMYQHFGCELYNTVTADNGVTRYSLCYHNDTSEAAERALLWRKPMVNNVEITGNCRR